MQPVSLVSSIAPGWTGEVVKSYVGSIVPGSSPTTTTA